MQRVGDVSGVTHAPCFGGMGARRRFSESFPQRVNARFPGRSPPLRGASRPIR